MSWHDQPPEGTQFYCWYHKPGACEPELVYIGMGSYSHRGRSLLDIFYGRKWPAQENVQSAWFGRDHLPIPVANLPGKWRHPAIPIPYDFPRRGDDAR